MAVEQLNYIQFPQRKWRKLNRLRDSCEHINRPYSQHFPRHDKLLLSSFNSFYKIKESSEEIPSLSPHNITINCVI